MKDFFKDLFIPHENNDHQPHFLRDKFSILFLCLILVLELFSFVFFSPFLGTTDFLASVFPSVLVEKVNTERDKIGADDLAQSRKLILAAQMKANDMAKNGYFAHVSPEGKTPWYWLDLAGYDYRYAGENLAVNFVDSNDVHRAWMNSPTHKKNILRDSFTEIGIATAEGEYNGKKAIFVAQFFGQPLEQSKTFVIDSDYLSTNPTDSGQVLGAEIVLIKDELPWYEKILSSPKTILMFVLYVLGAIVLLAVVLKVFVKKHIQYPKLIINGLLILVVISCLLYVNYIYTLPSVISSSI